jgi:hypothetical protein
VDFLFGRYKRPIDEEITDVSGMDDENAEKFELPGDILPNELIRINSGDDDPGKLPIDQSENRLKPEENFLEVGPNRTF